MEHREEMLRLVMAEDLGGLRHLISTCSDKRSLFSVNNFQGSPVEIALQRKNWEIYNLLLEHGSLHWNPPLMCLIAVRFSQIIREGHFCEEACKKSLSLLRPEGVGVAERLILALDELDFEQIKKLITYLINDPRSDKQEILVNACWGRYEKHSTKIIACILPHWETVGCLRRAGGIDPFHAALRHSMEHAIMFWRYHCPDSVDKLQPLRNLDGDDSPLIRYINLLFVRRDAIRLNNIRRRLRNPPFRRLFPQQAIQTIKGISVPEEFEKTVKSLNCSEPFAKYRAADLLALVLWIREGILQSRQGFWHGCNQLRFFAITQRIPLEIQMMLCLRVYNISTNYIKEAARLEALCYMNRNEQLLKF